MRRRSGIFAFITAALAASLAACGNDSASANGDADASTGAAKADTVYVTVRDTVYIPASGASTSGSSESADTSSSFVAESTSSSPTDTIASSSSAGGVTASSKATSSSDATSSSSAGGDTELNPKPFWNDEFEGTSLDESKWGYNIGTGDNGWGNGEWEYYTDRAENVYVKDGLLHIRANIETNADDIANKFGGQKYTSARIITQNKFTFAYGTVEARIALPAGKGIWPAFWMLGENIDKVSWPACGEIDIIEAINDENVIYGTHHWAHEGTHAQYGNSTKQHFDGHYDLDITEFHVYKMTWDKNAISMYVDDFMYQKIDITDAAGEMGTFHKPFFFILNVAVGGSWPGFDIDDAQFPTEMQVDYIRVYKEAP